MNNTRAKSAATPTPSLVPSTTPAAPADDGSQAAPAAANDASRTAPADDPSRSRDFSRNRDSDSN
jgi:hypothetical protein